MQLPLVLQPPPFKTDYFTTLPDGRRVIAEEWKRWQLDTTSAVNALLEAAQHLAGGTFLPPSEDAEPPDPLPLTVISTPPTVPSLPATPTLLSFPELSDEGEGFAIPSAGGGNQAAPPNQSIQFNNGGPFGGSAKLLFDGTTVQNAGGTITASDPFTITQTWNNGAITFQGVLIQMTRTAAGNNSQALVVIDPSGPTTIFETRFNNPGIGIGIRGTYYLFHWGHNVDGFGTLLQADANGNDTSAFAAHVVGAFLSFFLASGGLLRWSSGALNDLASDTGVSRLAAASIAIGNGTAGDTSGTLTLTTEKLLGLIAEYNGVNTVAWGVPAIYGSGRSTAQTAAVASVAAYTVGAADGSFEVSANVLVTTATSHNFTVTCAYTDEGNTARTLTMAFTLLAGVLTTAIVNGNGAVPYMGVPTAIRCKASTSITIATTGTFTTVTYNVEGFIKQVA